MIFDEIELYYQEFGEFNEEIANALVEEEDATSDDLDTMTDPETYLEDGAIEDYEEGFILGFTGST